MKVTPSGMAIFCDDIRQEAGGAITIVGANPRDEVIFPKGDAKKCMIPILGFYIRVAFPTKYKFEKLVIYAQQEEGDNEKKLFEIQYVAQTLPDAPEYDEKGNLVYFKLTCAQRIPGLECIPNGRIRVRMVFDKQEPIGLGVLEYKYESNE